MDSFFRAIGLSLACLLGAAALAACGGSANAKSGSPLSSGGLSAADIRPALASLPYEIHVREVDAPPRDTAAFRGHAAGPFHTVLKFTIGLGRNAMPIPVQGAGTRFAVYNGDEAGFVFNDNSSVGADFPTNAQWKEVSKMSVDIEERLCRRATGKPCPI